MAKYDAVVWLLVLIVVLVFLHDRTPLGIGA